MLWNIAPALLALRTYFKSHSSKVDALVRKRRIENKTFYSSKLKNLIKCFTIHHPEVTTNNNAGIAS